MSNEKKKKNCPGCGAKPGELHSGFNCDVERCAKCGRQAIGCDCVYNSAAFLALSADEQEEMQEEGVSDEVWEAFDAEVTGLGGRLPWTGEWPGVADCREWGLWCRGPKFIPCSPDHPEAEPDLNRWSMLAKWDPDSRAYYLPKAR